MNEKLINNLIALQAAQVNEEVVILTLVDGTMLSGTVDSFAPPSHQDTPEGEVAEVLVQDLMVFVAGGLIAVGDIERVV